MLLFRKRALIATLLRLIVSVKCIGSDAQIVTVGRSCCRIFDHCTKFWMLVQDKYRSPALLEWLGFCNYGSLYLALQWSDALGIIKLLLETLPSQVTSPRLQDLGELTPMLWIYIEIRLTRV